AGVISAGWATATRYYHTTADYENGLVKPEILEKQGRAYAFVIDELMKYDKADLEQGGFGCEPIARIQAEPRSIESWRPGDWPDQCSVLGVKQCSPTKQKS
ncbi:MAG: hypothetical protein KUG81_04825, partial [Gammaproteobacteria bacterium]|nr:hypothetical protein [Gammaproteobacteria bacterium]